jgi:hypothetical protein
LGKQVKRAEMAWRGELPVGWVREGHLIHHESRAGCEVSLQSVTPCWIDKDRYEFRKYRGFVITHGEVETISTKMNKKV